MKPKAVTAAGYHRSTSYHRHGLSAHRLEWAHQPLPIKRYPPLPRMPLDQSADLVQINFFDLAKLSRSLVNRPRKSIDLTAISKALRLTHSVTARSLRTDPPFYFRSVASAGALYPFELYLCVYQVTGMEPGVYHFDGLDVSLTTLRSRALPAIASVECSVAATFIITGIFFRSAWKYRDRAYRYVLLDGGHLLENLRLAWVAMARHASIHLDFDDDWAAAVLGLDPQREVCLACVHVYGKHPGEQPPEEPDQLETLSGAIRQASTVSDKTVDYSDILAIHHAGKAVVDTSGDVDQTLQVTANQPVSWIELNPPDHPQSADYVGVLGRRRSRRNFVRAHVTRDDLMTLIDQMASHMGRGAAMPSACRSALRIGFLVNAGLPVSPGFYLLDRDGKRLGRLSSEVLIKPMAAACLDQMWLKHAAVHLLFITDLAALDRHWGARGYRYAMIKAGRLGQQAYLTATALGWGACGIGAIYDREAADLLALTADSALLYLLGLGPFKN